MANKLLEELSHPFVIDGRDARIGASIGVAVFPQDVTTPEQLLERADLALYRVKNGERGGFREPLNINVHRKGAKDAKVFLEKIFVFFFAFFAPLR